MKAIILSDNAPDFFATKVLKQIKTIETRWYRWSGLLGKRVLICVSKTSESRFAGLAICSARVHRIRPMLKKDEKKACVGFALGRYSYILKDFHIVSRRFKFSDYKVAGAYQSYFDVQLPKDVYMFPYSASTPKPKVIFATTRSKFKP